MPHIVNGQADAIYSTNWQEDVIFSINGQEDTTYSINGQDDVIYSIRWENLINNADQLQSKILKLIINFFNDTYGLLICDKKNYYSYFVILWTLISYFNIIKFNNH